MLILYPISIKQSSRKAAKQNFLRARLNYLHLCVIIVKSIICLRSGGIVVEFILVLAVIAVLCLVIGVKPIYLLAAAAVLLGLIYILSLLLLMCFFARMLLAKKHKAVFSRIDKSPRSRFKVAYYTIDGVEYPNVFPEEGFMQDRLYRNDKSYTVFLARNKKFVFDKFSCATCTIGTALGIATALAAVLIITRI